MRWPIRNQILLPFVGIQVLTVSVIAVTSSWIAVRTTEDVIESQLTGVVDTLKGATFPLTTNVLRQLQSLSGAQFLLLNQDRTVVESTLDGVDSEQPIVSDRDWRSLNADVMENPSPIEIAGEHYFAGRVRWSNGRRGGYVLVLYRQADWRAARSEAMLPPLGIGALLLSATISTSIYLSRRFGRRIHRLQTQVARIADGDFQPMQTSLIDDELRDLSLAVNRMAVALADSMQTIRERERSRLLSQLVGGLAHQLRNAITGARISTQLHQRRCPRSDDEALQVALKQLAFTEEQIKSLLRVTRGEQRSPVRGSIPDALEATVALVNPLCEHQHIQLESSPCEMDWMISDADALRAALLNLVMNAIEAAGPGGTVRLSHEQDANCLRIQVADNGPGISDNHDVFQEYYSTKQEGVGLGLSLARRAIEDCGGTLAARRVEEMTVFEITLPQVDPPDSSPQSPKAAASEMSVCAS